MDQAAAHMIEHAHFNNHSSINLSTIAAFRYFGITIGLIDILIGVPGNLITILAVMGNKALRRQPFNLFVANLSMIDLLTCLVMMPFNVTGYVQMQWPYGVSTCILQAFFYFSCGYTSIVFLVGITLNRLIGIVSPTRYRFLSTTCVKFWILLCWLFAPTFLIPFVFSTFHAYLTGDTVHMLTGWKQEQFLCTFVNIHGAWRHYMVFLRILFQFFPIIVMVLSYAAMYYCIRRTNKRLQASNNVYKHYKSKAHKDNRRDEEIHLEMLKWPKRERSPFLKDKQPHQCTGTVYEIKNGQVEMHCVAMSQEKKEDSLERELHEKEVHMVHVSIMVCAVFTILFLPSLIINLFPGSHFFDPRLHMAASNLTWLNSCVNPFVYALMHKPMQKEYKRVLKQMYEYIQRVCCKIRRFRKG